MIIHANLNVLGHAFTSLLAYIERELYHGLQLMCSLSHKNYVEQYTNFQLGQMEQAVAGQEPKINGFTQKKDNMQIKPDSILLSQVEERLTDNPDLVGYEMIPIAAMFAGDFVSLDFTDNREEPSVCIWSHEESDELEPVTYKVANTFTEFLKMLY